MNQTQALRVGVVCDLLEEQWPSMDLVADQLMDALLRVTSPRVDPTRIRPTMPRWPRLTARRLGIPAAVNANRYLDRHRRYPRWLRRHQPVCDVFHVVDHTYAHLVHVLPASRTIVTCHDVDAFRCLFEPEREPRSAMFRAMTRRVLDGLRRAAVVTCDSHATREALVAHALRRDGLEVVPLGVHPAFTPGAGRFANANEGPVLLHVGSTIARKRIDVLLEVVARLHAANPSIRLVRVGGPFTTQQTAHVRALHIEDAVTVMPALSTAELAEQYRSATLVLLPSEREGFGLPVVEAMACGTPVVASDLPVLREVGGTAATYAPVGKVDAWVQAVEALLAERIAQPARWSERRDAAIRQASGFTWAQCAARMADLYAAVARG
jgi:glycosyltransferase involved in cell wall biosynthesis